MGRQYDPDIHHRRSIRMKRYNYAQAGAYFVTVCVQGKECLFGEISDGEMAPNEAGQMVERALLELPERFPVVEVDAYIVMPNHLHAIMIINDEPPAGEGATQHGFARLLGDIVGAFKSLTTNAYIEGVRTRNWPTFLGRLWQRNFHERIIRNERELNAIREYMANNPANWAHDEEYRKDAPIHL